MPRGPLTGVRVGVTGARKGPELCEALERRGASTVLGPTIEPDQPAPDDELLPQLDELLVRGADWFVANTGIGVRLLAAVADRHDRGGALRAVLDEATVVARGAKAVGGLRSIGVTQDHVTDAETDAAVAAWLGPEVATGDRLAVQYSGRTRGDYTALADERDLDLRVLRPYRTGIPADDRAARTLVRAAVDGELAVVVCTSAIAVDNLLAIAEREGMRDGLVAVCRHAVAAASIGAVTTAAFERAGITPTIVPDRHRTGPLLSAIESWAAGR